MLKQLIIIFFAVFSFITVLAEPKWIKQNPANDDEYYYEVGVCEYYNDDDIDSARIEAIKQAKFSFYNNLASDFMKLLNYELSIELKENKNYYSKYLNEFIYNSPIDSLIEEKENFNKKNQEGKIYYVLMKMPKQQFRQKIQEVIQDRVREINNMMTDVFQSINDKNYRKSLELLLRSYEKKEQYFPGLAMRITNLKELKDVQVDDYIRSNLNELLFSMIFMTDDDVSRYDIEGKMIVKPTVTLKYVNYNENETLNMQNVPVIISVEKGSELQYEERLVTTSNGKIPMSGKAVKNDNSVYVMRFKIDIEKILGSEISSSLADRLGRLSFPEKTIDLEPVKNVALVAVNSVMGKATDMSGGLYSSMNDIIKTKQYLLYKLQPPSSGNTSPENFDEENLEPFNYLIVIKSEGSTLEDSGLYYANVTYKCTVYELSTKNITKEFTTGYSESWGASKSEAVNSALEQQKNRLFKQIDNLILK